jgi:acyl-CoA dehydrogenase
LSQSTFAGFIVSVLVHTDMASPHLHHAGTAGAKSQVHARHHSTGETIISSGHDRARRGLRLGWHETHR